MQKHLFKITLLIGFICCTFISSLQAEQYLFTSLSEKSWMIPKANTMYKENGRCLWIGTDKGIYRFDGYDFKYYGEEDEATILQGVGTNHISMDDRGNLWALTSQGIGLYNRVKDRFEWASPDDFIHGSFFTTCRLADGLLFSGQGRILYYSYNTRKFSLFKDFHQTGASHNILHIYKVGGKNMILSNGNMVVTIDSQGNELAAITCPSVISCMYVDNEERIWVASFNKSLTCYDKKGIILNQFTAENSSLSNEIILCMEQQDSLLWLGTDGGGINILNTITHQIRKIEHIRGEMYSFPANSVNSLYKDLQNTIWAGSVRNGVIAIRKSLINSYIEVPENSKWGLSNPTILSFYQDGNNEHVWIGTDGEGLNKFNLQDRTFEHYPSTSGAKVASIAKFNENTLVLSLYMKGLFFFDIPTGNLRPLHVDKKELLLKMLLSKSSTNLYNFASNILVLSDEAFKYDTKAKHIEKIRFEARKGNDIVLPIGEYNGELFLYNEAAIYKLDSCATCLQLVAEIPDGQQIESASVDYKGNIWFTTQRGVFHFSLNTREIRPLASNLLGNVATIVTDREGRVWMGDEEKVYVYSDSTRHLAVFGESDGIIPNEYINKAHFLTSQGDIMIGGTRGLTVIDRNFKLEADEIPVITMTGIKIDAVEYNESAVQGLSLIEIPNESKSVEIHVSSIEEDLLRPKIYRYELKGTNEQLVETHSPVLRLHSFSPGESEIYVSCSMRNGEWTKPAKIATLSFMPPWYETGWFFTGCVLAFLIIGVYIMVTVFRRKENRLKLALKEKEKQIYEDKVNFLININHELRTPLTLISGPLQRILHTISASSSSYETLQKIYRQAERMKTLLNMVLDLRKMEVGDSDINIQSVSVNEWIADVTTDFSFDDDTMGPKIRLELGSEVGLANLDKGKCEIILTNLLVNAIKHSHVHDEIIVRSEITSDAMLTISVIDEGSGLKELQMDKLFQRFYQGDKEVNGSGIGLSYAKMLVTLHKGSVGAFNNDVKGATFYFKLPLDLPTGEHSCETKPYLNEIFLSDNLTKNYIQQQVEGFDTKNTTILIVDDNLELTSFLNESFSDKFSKIYLAHTGREAMEILTQQSVDVVVSDIMMPEMDGYQLCQKVKSTSECSHIPVILLTAMDEEKSRRLGYKMGADAYIAKPFETDTLYEIIRSKLKIREEIRQKYMKLSVLPEPQQDTFSQVDENFLIKLNDIIVENIANPSLDIPFVCEEIGMSRASLYNKIKAITGMSCNEYINKIRLERAAILVKTTSKSFIEIADETGYANSRYFSTSFKQNTGMTPTQYRKEYGMKKS